MGMGITDKIGILLGEMPPNKLKYLKNIFKTHYGHLNLEVHTSTDTLNGDYIKVIVFGDLKVSAKVKSHYNILSIPSQYDFTEANKMNFMYFIDGVLRVEPLVQYKILTDVQDVLELYRMCRTQDEIAFDFETEGVEWWKDKPTLLSITFQAGFSYLIPIYHYEVTWSDVDLHLIMQGFREIMEDYNITKIGHNLKFDLHVYKTWFKGAYKGILHDTMLLHHLLQENTLQDLETVSIKFFPECFGYSISPTDWSRVPLETLAYYAAIDTNNTFRLKVVLEDMLLDAPDLYNYYCNITIPLLKTVEGIESNGVYVDTQRIQDSIKYGQDIIDTLYKELISFKEVIRFNHINTLKATEEKIAIIEAKKALTKRDTEQLNILRTAPPQYEINFASPKQLADLLYSEDGFNFPLPINPLTKEQVISTASEYLQDIHHPFIETLMTYRSALKIMGTYYESLNKAIVDGKIHTTFLLHGTVTGRLSSRNPNLQNLIMRTNYERLQGMVDRVKEFFVPPTNTIFVGADLSQAELRVIASVANDPIMIKAYNDGIDLHTTTAARLAGKPLEEFKELPSDERKHFRQIAKSANFGYVYGLSAEGYQNYVKVNTGKDISLKEAKAHRQAIFGTYTNLEVWHTKAVYFAKQMGYAVNLFGRKRHLPDINFSGRLGEAAQRQSINAPIQGASADWCNLIMILGSMVTPPCVRWFNNIHDAIYFYSPEHILLPVMQELNIMAVRLPLDSLFNMSKFKVPMKLEFSVSEKDWASVEEITL